VTTFLVGVDGSKAAAQALSWACGLAGFVGPDRLIIATVYVAEPTSTSSWDQAHDRTRERLEQWCQPARDHGVAYESVLLDGESGPALLAMAAESDSDLSVVSRRGCGGFDALVAGSTADYLAHHTRRPLAIVPPEATDSPPAHLLIALDGSSGSAAAATWAAQLATRLQARVTVAHVLVPSEIVGLLTAGQRASADEILTDHWAAPLRRAGLAPDYRVVESRHPADALIELARDANADLIVAGTRAVGGLRPIRLGGVTMQLLHHSAVPVIVVPPQS
jgi:nucleotide-binding universal stress UspA family protein